MLYLFGAVGWVLAACAFLAWLRETARNDRAWREFNSRLKEQVDRNERNINGGG